MTETEPEMTDLDALLDKLAVIRRELCDEYFKPLPKPWIIGFFGQHGLHANSPIPDSNRTFRWWTDR